MCARSNKWALPVFFVFFLCVFPIRPLIHWYAKVTYLVLSLPPRRVAFDGCRVRLIASQKNVCDYWIERIRGVAQCHLAGSGCFPIQLHVLCGIVHGWAWLLFRTHIGDTLQTPAPEHLNSYGRARERRRETESVGERERAACSSLSEQGLGNWLAQTQRKTCKQCISHIFFCLVELAKIVAKKHYKHRSQEHHIAWMTSAIKAVRWRDSNFFVNRTRCWW